MALAEQPIVAFPQTFDLWFRSLVDLYVQIREAGQGHLTAVEFGGFPYN